MSRLYAGDCVVDSQEQEQITHERVPRLVAQPAVRVSNVLERLRLQAEKAVTIGMIRKLVGSISGCRNVIARHALPRVNCRQPSQRATTV